MVGSILDDRYRVLKKLGEGGMGEVFLVEHIALGKKEALKVLRQNLLSEPQFASRFRREARVINRLQHPNIVQLYDFGLLTDGRTYLAMEFAEGRALDGILRTSGRMSVPRTLHLVSQLVDALDHAHSRGVVHRDLKPENLILVEHRGRGDVLKVLDFGIAKVVSPDYQESVALSNQNEIFGTPHYMAPERFTNTASAPASDLYAIGCLMMEFLTGEPPFTGRPMQILHAHTITAPPIASTRAPDAGIPPKLDALIDRLLAKNPEDRYDSAADLKRALMEVPGFGAYARASGSVRLTPRGTAEFGGDTVRNNVDAFDGETLEALSHNPANDPLLVRERLLLRAKEAVRAGKASKALIAAITALEQTELERAALAARQGDLGKRVDEVEQGARIRAADLRFELGELRFERAEGALAGAGVDAARDAKIRDLEKRIIEDDVRARREAELLEEANLSIAVEMAELDERGALAQAAIESDLG